MINDIAGYGRCSTTVSLPIINAMGVQVCPVPTSIFSNHTGFPSYQFLDLTENMKAYLAQWQSMRLSFDGIYCGFLGSVAQIKIVNDFLSSNITSVIIIDPVMGDNGRTYSTVTEEHCAKMKELLRHASIVTPNITEACLLSDTPYKDSGWTEEELLSIAEILHENGPDKIVITGIRKNDTFVNFIFESDKTPVTYRSEERRVGKEC